MCQKYQINWCQISSILSKNVSKINKLFISIGKNLQPNMKIIKQESGITGLETAIILISFVVVAAVFAYTALSAGLFSTQKSQEAVYSGLERTQSTLELKSAVIGKAINTGAQGYLSQITFTLSNALGGTPVDLTPPLTTGTNGLAPAGSPNKVTISYKDSIQKVDDLFWTVSQLGRNNGNNLLDPDEQFEITIGSAVVAHNGGNLVDALSRHLVADTRFTLDIKGANGSTLVFERNTPSWIDRVINLDTVSGVNLSINQISLSTVTFTAMVMVLPPGTGTPTGTIQFNIDGTPFGDPVTLVGGNATSLPTNSLSVGSHTITAVYSGDSDFNGNTGTLTQVVNAAP
jgi:archaeal flagellin FlaB